MANYDYPIEPFWTKEEIVDVIHFFNMIEQVYETSADREELLVAYNKFKKIVPSKSDEKTYFNEFQEKSSYSSYHAVKEARSNKNVNVSL